MSNEILKFQFYVEKIFEFSKLTKFEIEFVIFKVYLTNIHRLKNLKTEFVIKKKKIFTTLFSL